MTTDPRDAEIARLKTEIERLGRDLNRAKYGEPDFSWAIHDAAMVELRDRAEKAEAERDEARTDLGRIIMSLPTGKGERAAGAVEGVRKMRARLEAERDAALAQVAGAFQAAAEMAREGFMIVAPEGVGQRQALDNYRAQISGNIMTLTPADETTALDHIRAQAKAEGLREAAGIARSIIDGRVYFNERARSDDEAFACAILAAAEKGD